VEAVGKRSVFTTDCLNLWRTMSEEIWTARRTACVTLLGLLLFFPGVILANDEDAALAALKHAIQEADPKLAQEAFQKDHQSPPSKQESEKIVATIVNAAISVMDQTAEFEKHFPQSKEFAGNRDSLVETLSTVFGNMGLPVPQKRAADLEACARKLIGETPDNIRLYMVLCRVADASPFARQRALYEELSRESTPEPARNMARTAMRKIERLGLPINLSFTALDGRHVSLAELKGKVVLLDFWATTCVPCVSDLPDLKRLYTKYNPQGLEIVGVSLDSDKTALTRFVKKEKIPWPQYYDPAGQTNRLAQEYGITGIPVVWLVDRHGLLRQLNARQDQDQKVEALLKE
jgi:thiol-disulfide isomerase/thioredoxin